ncbi:MAG: NADP oxidoreductase, partial [Actinomycetota bacterium]|nr:NADP oxidoreductase [Actinomycetota bacterium]
KVEEIVILGRRGPVQAAFTNPELRELADLELADVIVDPAELELDATSAAALEMAEQTVQRNVETLRAYAKASARGRPRRVILRFLASPVAIEGDGRVEAIVVARNELVIGDDGSLRARPTGVTERLETGLVLRAVGYVGRPLAGVPYDERRTTVLNDSGRVLDPLSGRPIPGLYAAGWIKRGPSGVIGTNKRCAQETTSRLIDDFRAGLLPEPPDNPEALLDRIRAAGVKIIDYAGWERIDAHERSLGEPAGRPRVKLVRREEQLERASAGA